MTSRAFGESVSAWWSVWGSTARRPILPLGHRLSQLQARALEWLPGPLMSRDNLASMTRDSVCGESTLVQFGCAPTALEAVAPGYLATGAIKSRYDEFRAQSGR